LNDKNIKIPRIVIGGTHSGVGKTTVTLGLIAALKTRGLTVQPFKVGPDYLDTTYHTLAAGLRCRNLDGWMTDRRYVRSSFANAASRADISVVEGVMGVFDGVSPTSEEGSTAQMAKWLQAPLVLVADAKGVARSAAAMVKGYTTFDGELTVAGVILNNLGSASHLDILREAVEPGTGVEVLGGLPRDDCIELPHRHLGLVTADEDVLKGEKLNALADLVLDWIDVDSILKIASSSAPIEATGIQRHLLPPRCRIAVAMDEAFHFYYADNLELLEDAGAELVHFSPLRDRSLPEGINGLYLGGGYPEVYAADLEGNKEMRDAIRSFAEAGGPVYAECGGFMYLCRSIRTLDGRKHEMAGVLPMRTRMLEKLGALRYVEVTATERNILAEQGAVFRGHEFHYSRIEEEPQSGSGVRLTYNARGRKAEHSLLEGYSMYNVLAGYIHLHFGSNPSLAANFTKNCHDWAARV
jgi:cobyrinic acid a,c-diamide synthase